MKTRYRFWCPFIGGARRRLKMTRTRCHYSSMKSISGFSDAGTDFGVAGHREAAADGAGGTKPRRERRLMNSPPFPKITGFIIPSFWTRRGRHLWSIFWTIHQRRGCATQRHNRATSLRSFGLYNHLRFIWRKQLSWQKKIFFLHSFTIFNC